MGFSSALETYKTTFMEIGDGRAKCSGWSEMEWSLWDFVCSVRKALHRISKGQIRILIEVNF